MSLVYPKMENYKNALHWPGVKPRPPAWQVKILPVNYQCSVMSRVFLRMTSSSFIKRYQQVNEPDAVEDRTKLEESPECHAAIHLSACLSLCTVTLLLLLVSLPASVNQSEVAPMQIRQGSSTCF